MKQAPRHFKFKIQQEERICPLCKNGAEDEIHFVMKCTQFEELHAKMLQLVENKYVAFKSLNDEQKLFDLFTNPGGFLYGTMVGVLVVSFRV